MALEYFKYITTYGNTIVDRSNTSFSPIPPYGQIYIDYFIPDTQPLYLYRNVGGSGGTIVVNTQENIDAYLGASELPPTPDGNVTYGEFTGTTTALSATTTALEVNKVNVSGDTMSGDLYFGIETPPASRYGRIGKNQSYSGLDIQGLAGLSLNTPYWVNPQWSGYSGSYLTIGASGLITFTTPPTGATSWQVTGGTNSIVANVPENLGFIVTVTSSVTMGTIEWNIDFTNSSTNQSANVTLQLVVNGTPNPNGVNYSVAKNETSKLFGSAPISGTIASGTTFDIRITSDKNGVVNRSLLKVSKSGSAGGGSAVWGGITGNILSQTDLQSQFGTKLNTSVYQVYTGTTAPATYLTKTAFNTYTGTTVPANYYNKTQINSYTGTTATAIGLKLDKTTFSTYTGTTVPNTYYNKTQINSYTASTLTNINSRLLTSVFNTYTGTTEPTIYLKKTTFATYSGTTVPNTYYNKTQINSYSASTLTNINSRLLTTIYSNYTGTTVPNTYYNKTQINSYSASTLTNINSRLLTATFNTWSGTTLPNTYLKKTTFATYTGTTAPNQFASKVNAITGATNLGSGNGTLYTTVSGNKINLKSLSGGTNVTITCNGNYVAINASSSGLGWTGSTANGVATYASATRVCSNPNMTFNGSSLSVTGNILASTYMCSPIITGSTRVCSPIVCATSCLRSPSICTTALSACQVVFANPTSVVLTGSTGLLYNPTTCTLCVANVQKTSTSGYFYSECLTNRTTTSTTCVKAHGYSATTAAGTYQVDVNLQYGNATSNACTLISVKIDNVAQGSTMFGRVQGAGWVSSASIMRDISFTNALHCVDIWYWNASGTACVPISTIRLQRIC